ncbi:MAG: hypothetical protein ACF8GE_02710 [Phycisphaerales bacterium JB043]
MAAPSAHARGRADARPTLFVTRWLAIVLLGGLLLFASVAKSMTGQWEQIAIALFEVVLVGAMIAWRGRALMWFGVMGVFVAFFGFTLMRWLGGASTCGCFGAIAVRPEVTLWLDVGASVLAGGCALLHAGSFQPLASLVSTGVVAGALGMLGATLTSPPPSSHYMSDEVSQLLAASEFSELGDEDGPSWYVFLHNPTCPLCKKYLPQMERLEASSASHETFRVRTIDLYELEASQGIPSWSWGETPIMLEISDGEVVTRQQGFDFLDPEEVASRYISVSSGSIDPLTRLESSEWFEPLRASSSEYWLVVVVEDGRCDTIRQQVATYQTNLGQNDVLFVESLTHAEGEGLGIAPQSWGASCLGVLYREGDRLGQFTGEDIPEPLTLWADLQSGTVLEFE